MNYQAITALLASFVTTTAGAWVEQNPPFSRGKTPQPVVLTPVSGTGNDVAHTFTTKDAKTAKLVLAVGAKGGTTLAIMDQTGKVVYGPRSVAETAYLPKQIYTGDLNKDGIPDYVIAVESGGNGVAADIDSVVVVLSGSGNPRVWSMSSYSFNPEDVFQTPQGGSGLIQADYTGAIRGKDGKKHYFLAYQTYEIDHQEIRLLGLTSFPKLVLMTKEYHATASSLLSSAQKADFFKKLAGPKEP